MHCWSQVRFIKTAVFCQPALRAHLPREGDITTPFECTNCREMELHFSSARSAVVARGVVLEVIHRFKYRRQLWFENFLAGLFLREAVPALRGQGWNLIMPVPLHSLRQREREFNQAGRLAWHLATALKIPLNDRRLRRVTPTTTQTLLTRQERAENMRGAFDLRPGVPFEPGTGGVGGRCFYDRGDDERLRPGTFGRRGGRSLRLDSGAGTLVLFRGSWIRLLLRRNRSGLRRLKLPCPP